MALAISMGWAARRNGMAATKVGSMCAIGSIAGVIVGPSATALTRTPWGPYSAAQERVSDYAAVSRNGALTLTANMASKPASVASAVGANSQKPALLTRMSTSPAS